MILLVEALHSNLFPILKNCTNRMFRSITAMQTVMITGRSRCSTTSMKAPQPTIPPGRLLLTLSQSNHNFLAPARLLHQLCSTLVATFQHRSSRKPLRRRMPVQHFPHQNCPVITIDDLCVRLCLAFCWRLVVYMGFVPKLVCVLFFTKIKI